MTIQKLENYLRAFRKRTGLSQDDLAFLLIGLPSGTLVSRYEHGQRKPPLKTLLAYEVLFDTGSNELFAGVFNKMEQTVLKRVDELILRLKAEKKKGLSSQKLKALEAIVERYPKLIAGETK